MPTVEPLCQRLGLVPIRSRAVSARKLTGASSERGFDYTDYETGGRAALVASHPDARELVTALTRPEPTR